MKRGGEGRRVTGGRGGTEGEKRGNLFLIDFQVDDCSNVAEEKGGGFFLSPSIRGGGKEGGAFSPQTLTK